MKIVKFGFLFLGGERLDKTVIKEKEERLNFPFFNFPPKKKARHSGFLKTGKKETEEDKQPARLFQRDRVPALDPGNLFSIRWKKRILLFQLFLAGKPFAGNQLISMGKNASFYLIKIFAQGCRQQCDWNEFVCMRQEEFGFQGRVVGQSCLWQPTTRVRLWWR